jgi:hypothetical protein
MAHLCLIFGKVSLCNLGHPNFNLGHANTVVGHASIAIVNARFVALKNVQKKLRIRLTLPCPSAKLLIHTV